MSIEKTSYVCISVLNSHESIYVFKHENKVFACVPADAHTKLTSIDVKKAPTFHMQNQPNAQFIALQNAGHTPTYLLELVKSKWELFVLFHQSMYLTPYYSMIPYQTFQVHIYEAGNWVQPLMMVPSQYIFKEGFERILPQIQQAQDGLMKWLML